MGQKSRYQDIVFCECCELYASITGQRHLILPIPVDNMFLDRKNTVKFFFIACWVSQNILISCLTRVSAIAGDFQRSKRVLYYFENDPSIMLNIGENRFDRCQLSAITLGASFK